MSEMVLLEAPVKAEEISTQRCMERPLLRSSI